MSEIILRTLLIRCPVCSDLRKELSSYKRCRTGHESIRRVTPLKIDGATQ